MASWKQHWLIYGARPKDFAFAGLTLGFFILWRPFNTPFADPFANTKKDHEILPIYDETNKLIGFTHPTLVEEAASMRNRGAGS